MIYDRVDNEKPYVGMTNFKGDYVTIDDVKIAKNYLSGITKIKFISITILRLCRITGLGTKNNENARLGK